MIPATAMQLTEPVSTTLTFQEAYKVILLVMFSIRRSLSSRLLLRQLGLRHKMNRKMRR
jgi:hypothetical protein